jgi:nitroreductase
MDAYNCILTKLDVREFSGKQVPGDVKRKAIEAARMTGSSMNTQHWRFVLIQDKSNLKKLAKDSTTGAWVENADFAVIILVNPKVPGSTVDGGRVLQDMEVAAWDFGVASGLYTGFKEDALRRDFGIPPELKVEAALGFGYPKNKIVGKKDRKPIEQLAFLERYGNQLNVADLG